MTESNESVREIRINPIVPTESVLVATARGMRPKTAEERIDRDTRAVVETCPFCRGNEERTPPEIKRYPEAGDWDIRIVPNLYPVLGDDRSQSNIAFGLQQVIDGYGRHEVVIDNPNHGIALHEMDRAHLASLFRSTSSGWQSSMPRIRASSTCWCSRTSAPRPAPAFRTRTAR